jgi:hypothetical protein
MLSGGIDIGGIIDAVAGSSAEVGSSSRSSRGIGGRDGRRSGRATPAIFWVSVKRFFSDAISVYRR